MPENENALEEMRAMIAAARQEFHDEVYKILRNAQVLADSFAMAVGEVSAVDALSAWKATVRTRLE